MEHKGHTHVKFYVTHSSRNPWEILTDIPYRFRVEAYLTTQEFNELTDEQKIQVNEIREVDFPIIDRLIADDNFWELYYQKSARLNSNQENFTDILTK